MVGKPAALIAPGLGPVVALALPEKLHLNAGTSLSRQVLERISNASFRLWTRWTVVALGAVYLASGVAIAIP